MFGTFFVPGLMVKEDLMTTNTMNKDRKKKMETQSPGEVKLKGFLDMIAPSVIQFYTDHYVCGNTYRSVWALREYPTATDEQAILRHLGEKDGVTLRIYTRQVTSAEEKKIISNAANKNRMKQGTTENLQETVTAASNLQDVTNIIAAMHRNREPLLHTAVFLELSAPDVEKLKLLQTEVLTELIRSKLNVDRLLLRQKQGFMCVQPAGRNVFWSSLSVHCQPPAWQICSRLTTLARQIKMVFISAGTNLAPMSSWTLTRGRMIKPMPTF